MYPDQIFCYRLPSHPNPNPNPRLLQKNVAYCARRRRKFIKETVTLKCQPKIGQVFKEEPILVFDTKRTNV